MRNPRDDGESHWHEVWAHRDDLLRVARRRVPDVADAEDCVSEAMLRAVQHSDLDVERVGAFLTVVTVRLCADVHRDRQRRTAAVVLTEPAEPSPEVAVCDRAEAAWASGLVRHLLTATEVAAVQRRAWGGAPPTSAKADRTALARARAKLLPLLSG